MLNLLDVYLLLFLLLSYT